MLNWRDFDAVFRSKGDHSLDSKQVETISRHRKELGGTLYFDRIWTSIGLKQPQKSYPPKSNQELRNLWAQVTSTSVADEQKQALLFYILRDCKQPHNIDTVFARKVYLPVKYQVLISGLWELDHGQFQRALEHLTDPVLSNEFSDDILLTLLTSSKCDDSLAMAYALTVSPPLTNEETLSAYFSLLVQTNVVEAYHFARARGGTNFKELFEVMVHNVIEGEEAESTSERAKRLTTLLGLPLAADEEQWLEDYLLRGQGSRLPGAKDSIIMRRIATGRSFKTVGPLDRYQGAEYNGVTWDNVRHVLPRL